VSQTPRLTYENGIPPMGMSRSFVNNVRLAIQAQQRTKVRTEQRTGRLYKRALVRPLLPPVDGGKWNSKIFYKREETRKINTAVTVMVDVSGSMCAGSGKLEHASMATCLLVNVLSRALKVPTEVLAFAFHGNKCSIGIVKDFNTALTTDAEVAGGVYSSYKYGGGGNDDANALLYGYARLIKRHEQKRIMIVLSDGSPADDPNDGDADANLLYVVQMIRKVGKVDLHGVGIMHPNVIRYYGKGSSVIRTPADLEKVLVDTLSQKVFI